MRLRMTFSLPQPLELPYSLHYALMSYVYQAIQTVDPVLAKWLHQEGIAYHGRSYKPFIFSPLSFDERQSGKEKMKVSGNAVWKVDSIRPEIVQAICHGVQAKGYLQLLHHRLPLETIEMEERPWYQRVMNYFSLGPIVVPIQREGQLVYCHPLQSEFYDQLRESLLRWARFKWGTSYVCEEAIHIRLRSPERFSLKKAAVLNEIKGKKIKGYLIPLQIEAPAPIQEVVMEAGLGSYGSQGFGMMAWNR
ncbi:MAG: CRISPR-associated endoribonuclease Cas6 [Thermoactinomyces sp.]